MNIQDQSHFLNRYLELQEMARKAEHAKHWRLAARCWLGAWACVGDPGRQAYCWENAQECNRRAERLALEGDSLLMQLAA